MRLICPTVLPKMCLHQFNNPHTLTYHSIDSKFHLGLNFLHPDKFRQHVEFITESNKSGKYKHPIAIAFDDGYESVIKYAFPIMEEFGIKGIVFPVTAYIGKYNDWDVNFCVNRSRHLNISQILQLSNYGWEIGSHGHMHRAYNWMKTIEVIQDLDVSKKILEDITGKKINSFCPPFGILTNESIENIINIGYKNLFVQMPYRKNKIKSGDIRFRFSRSIYSTDNINNINHKCHNYKSELIRENIIHSLSKATVIAKEIL